MAWWLAIGIVYATTVYAWVDLGQREYIMVLLLLPYLVIAALRLDGVSPAAGSGFMAGAAAAVALSIKPQHLLIVIGIELWLAYRNGLWRSLIRPEVMGAVIATLAYFAAIVIFAPDYFTKIIFFAYRAYLGYQNATLQTLIDPRRIAKIVALLLLYVVLRRRLAYRSFGEVFAIAGIGATIAYLIQHKGWQYQFLPAETLFLLLLLVIVADLFIQWGASLQKPPLQAGVAAALALISCLLVASAYYPIQSAKAAAHVDEKRVVLQQAILAAVPTGTTIAVLGPNYSTIFDYVLKYRVNWGSRFEGFWTLEAIFDAEKEADETVRRREAAQLAEVAHWTRAAAAEDLRRWKPSLVLVEICDDPTITCGTTEPMREISVLPWFEEDAAFKADWSDYERCREIGYFDVWYSKQAPDICRALDSIPSRPNIASPSRPTR